LNTLTAPKPRSLEDELRPAKRTAAAASSPSSTHVQRWLDTVGRGYAHDAAAFREEIARLGVDDGRAEEMRLELLEGGPR
jgi:hypothetical protein